jgi:sulfur carrier protein
MLLKINGKEQDVGKTGTLLGLLEEKGLGLVGIVVEHNSEIIPREKWDDLKLKENDTIEIIRFVGGG